MLLVTVLLVKFYDPHLLKFCLLKPVSALQAGFLVVAFEKQHWLVSDWLQQLCVVAEVLLCPFVVRHTWLGILGEALLTSLHLPYGSVLFSQIGFIYCNAEAFHKQHFRTMALLRK